MDVIRQKVRVDFEYPVYFTTGVVTPSNLLLRDVVARSADRSPSRLVVVLDQGVLDHHPRLPEQIAEYAHRHRTVLSLSAPVVVVPGGEAVKNDPRHVDDIHRAINDAGLCRHSYVVAIGGGAVLDAAGYAAATAHRGIRLIRVPTTVLAQDDSAMGVKNGINAFGKKNYLGTFAPPFAVINDVSFLGTLPDRHWRAGVSEAIKAALIKDRAFFDFLEEHAAALTVARSVGDGAGDPALRRAAPVAHLERRRSVRARLVAAAGLRPLVGAQARAADRPPAEPRRSRGDRDRARHDLFVSGGFPSRRRLAADHLAAAGAWPVGVRARARPEPGRAKTIRRACCAGSTSSGNTLVAR